MPSQDHPLHQRDLVGRVMPTQPFRRLGWGRRVTWCCEKGSSPLMFQLNSRSEPGQALGGEASGTKAPSCPQ